VLLLEANVADSVHLIVVDVVVVMLNFVVLAVVVHIVAG
jgi:hypothetical protein